MNTSLLDRVRTGCRAVAQIAIHVRIDHTRIPSYAASLPLENIAEPEIDPNTHYLGHGDDTVAFFLTLDTINFGSGYFPHLRKRPGMSGYYTVASCLSDHFGEHGPLSAQELTHITVEDCAMVFGQDVENAPIGEMMQLFSTALNDLGRYLLDCYDGSFVGLVEAADSSAEKLVRLLTEMPFFRDVQAHGDLKVPFYKRAQLTAADLATAFRGQGPGHFRDLDRLTIFADNLVPHVLRTDGILLYDDDLADRISRGELIRAGSEQEVEIRACGVHAVELLVQHLREMGHNVPAMKLDYLLWHRGHNPLYKGKPRHRTRTVYY